MKKRWYVVNIYSGYEKKVISDLKNRIKIYKLETSFGKMIVPSEKKNENLSGKIRKIERKYYPGYILLEMELNDKTWKLVNETKRVVRFIGANVIKPEVIKKKELKKILSNIKKHIDKNKFNLGERVRVIEGPFTDFTGIVEEINSEKNKLQVSVLIFGRSTPVELEFYKVIKDI
ncbi:Transcription antitermination protein NusG [Candidatus Portiera aleyrodidarum]|uniref:Transcription termination/antitermination protein NusG n=1 Tax=Candidatus Portiera aleyrodidarum TV TaxID=1297582 RepID=A0A8D3X7F8_9GAMM|nr:transcription termination/antitermination protein NusG [Candidatus Portiera aleyrodidarum]AGI27139.1 transcription antitermination protein nusG [Candidatus Portiera aleyrodidarum TV]CEI59111.1 Transcription antitermination protein NusG [Candidatus Portiera aleyrodidarum]